MCAQKLSHDENWPRANTLFTAGLNASDFALIGIPAHKSSLSPTSANLTPTAIRETLARYSTFAGSTKTDLTKLAMVDLGDVTDPDFADGESKVAAAVENLLASHKLVMALGGDNSITYSVARGLWRDLSNVGVITFDAHHDLRDGQSNGSPIWRLIQAGLPGKNIVQIGISDFANSAAYSKRAEDNGITVIDRAMMRSQSIEKDCHRCSSNCWCKWSRDLCRLLMWMFVIALWPRHVRHLFLVELPQMNFVTRFV